MTSKQKSEASVPIDLVEHAWLAPVLFDHKFEFDRSIVSPNMFDVRGTLGQYSECLLDASLFLSDIRVHISRLSKMSAKRVRGNSFAPHAPGTWKII